MGWVTSVEKKVLLNAVKRSGAVSPAIRASARRIGQNARQGRRQDNGEDGPSSRRAKRQCAFLERRRHEAQQFLGGPHDERDHHHAQGQAARGRRELPERQNRNAVDEHADDNRRHAVQRVRRKSHRRCQSRPCVLGRVDPADDPHGYREERPNPDHDERTDDGVAHPAALFPDRRGHVREEVDVQRRDALRDDVEQDERERDQRDDHGHAAKDDDEVRQRLAPTIANHAAAFAGTADFTSRGRRCRPSTR
jgi:hypothetical protein